jgi:hypothetical protein
MDTAAMLRQLGEDFAAAVPAVDATAEHDRWQAGIGPFEEEQQIERLREAVAGTTAYLLRTEVSYPAGGKRADILIEHDEVAVPIEAKLLRFRYDNGNIDPNSFAKVFSPFPERTTATLLTDARALADADFAERGGLLGLYYAPDDEPYERMTPEAIAEKFALDVDYWYDFGVETRAVAHFDGLRHPVHERGPVITWQLIG